MHWTLVDYVVARQGAFVVLPLASVRSLQVYGGHDAWGVVVDHGHAFAQGGPHAC